MFRTNGDITYHAFLYIRMATFLLIFVHPTVTTYMIQIYNCRAIYNTEETIQYWLEMDMTTQCYTKTWWIYCSISLFVCVVYVLGLPIGFALITNYYHRYKKMRLEGRALYMHQRLISIRGKTSYFLVGTDHQLEPIYVPQWMQSSTTLDHYNIATKLDNSLFTQYLGHFLIPFERNRFYWVAIDITHEVLQSSAVIIVRIMLEEYDLVFATTVAVVTLAFYTYYKPHVHPTDSAFQTLVLLSYCFIYIAFLTQRYVHGEVSGEEESVNGYVLASIIGLLCSSMIFVIIRNYIDVYSSTLEKIAAPIPKASIKGWTFEYAMLYMALLYARVSHTIYSAIRKRSS